MDVITTVVGGLVVGTPSLLVVGEAVRIDVSTRVV